MSGFGQSQRLMIVDHDEASRAEIAAYLSLHGFSVTEADSGDAMRQALSGTAFDLIVLEPALPDGDGQMLLGELRQNGRARCIILTVNDEPVDRIVALELGADDYLIKPMDRRELLARVRAVLRRAPAQSGYDTFAATLAKSASPSPSGLVFERVQRRLSKPDGSKVQLTTAEFNLLVSFADYVNVPLTREKLYDLVYHRNWNAYDRTLDTLVAKLRRKIEQDPQRPELIKTVHGIGYLFTGVDFS